MEKLIEIQSLIMKYEELMGLKPRHKTKFNFKNEKVLILETYCKNARRTYEQMFEVGLGITVYTVDNTTIEIHCW